MQGLGGQHLGVGVEVVGLHVPTVGGGAAEDGNQIAEIHTARQGDGVLTIGGEDVVVGGVGQCGADLRGLLASARNPQGELALALQGGRLVVEAAGGVHEAVGLAQGITIDVFDVSAEGGVFVDGAVLIHELDAFGHSRVLVVLVHLTSTRDDGFACGLPGLSLILHERWRVERLIYGRCTIRTGHIYLPVYYFGLSAITCALGTRLEHSVLHPVIQHMSKRKPAALPTAFND